MTGKTKMRFIKGIKGKFMVPTLIMLAVALNVMTYVNYSKTRDALISSTTEQLQYIAQSLAEQTDQWVSHDERDRVIAWASDGTNALALSDSYIGKSARKRLTDSLKEKLQQYPQYEKISVINVSGQVSVSTDEALLDATLPGITVTDQTIIGTPVISQTTSQPVIKVVTPVKDKAGAMVGAVVADLNLTFQTQNLFAALKLGQSGHAILFDNQQQILTHPKKEMLFKSNPAYTNVINGKQQGLIHFTDPQGASQLAVLTPMKTLPWSVLVVISQSEAMATVNRIRLFNLGMMLLVLIVIGTSLYFISLAVVKPLIRTTQIFQDLAEGDGDLTKRIQIKGHDEIAQLGQGFNTFVDKIYTMVSDVASVSRDVASASIEMAATIEEISIGMQKQSQQTMSVSGAVEQMNATVMEVARQSSDANLKAQQAGKQAQQGDEEVMQTVTGMTELSDIVNSSAMAINELGDRSKQIGQIINVINDIADQTNLLALNAAIEAARAGEHGRGFAVVADEVRKLAERTTKATEEVGNSIKAIQSETGTAVERMKKGTANVALGVEQAQKAGVSLRAIVDGARSVSSMIEMIAAASNQQATTSQEIARNIEGIDSVTRNSVESTRQAATATEQLSEKAEQLQHLVNQFKL